MNEHKVRIMQTVDLMNVLKNKRFFKMEHVKTVDLMLGNNLVADHVDQIYALTLKSF